MPLVIVNMGGEMVYILAQRLQAQNVPLDKSKRVLQDVIRTMYNKMFIEELFRPQDVYSVMSVRQIFDRLALSSIMRLNESSMYKLFDLMAMGFKYQMLSPNSGIVRLKFATREGRLATTCCRKAPACCTRLTSTLLRS